MFQPYYSSSIDKSFLYIFLETKAEDTIEMVSPDTNTEKKKKEKVKPVKEKKTKKPKKEKKDNKKEKEPKGKTFFSSTPPLNYYPTLKCFNHIIYHRLLFF